MKKIILILFIIPLFSVASYGINESISESISNSSTIENPDFSGVWRVIYEGRVLGFQIIWKDSRGQYKTIYMDPDNETTHTKDVYLKNKKLIIKSVFIKTNWEVTRVLEIIDENTISVEGINESGTFTQTLIRI